MVIPLGSQFDQRVHLMIKKDGKLVDKVLQAHPVRPDDRQGNARPEGAKKPEEASEGAKP